MDNDPEFVCAKLTEWAEQHGIELEFIQPAMPTQNSYVERFNHIYHNEILNMHVLKTLNEVRKLTENRIREYNEERPHSYNDGLSQVAAEKELNLLSGNA